MRVIDFETIGVLIGEFRLQCGDDEFVVALACKVDAAILESLNGKFRSFGYRFPEGLIFFQVPVVCGGGAFDNLARLHDVAGVDVFIDQDFANIVRPFEIVDQPSFLSLRRICRQSSSTTSASRRRNETRRAMAVLTGLAVVVMFEAPRSSFGAGDKVMLHRWPWTEVQRSLHRPLHQSGSSRTAPESSRDSRL